MTARGPSPFAVRGVIEGFYGRPWRHEQRLGLITFIAARGMNTFVYAPKDDPLLRRDWRDVYAGDDLVRLTELIAHGRREGVDVIYCLSPGLSIRYANDDDVTALCAKLDAVGAIGATTFGLLLDDIPLELQHAEDRRRFGSLVDAHVSVIGRVADHLGPARRLVVCPTVYHGYGDESYIARLGEGVDPRVDIFWTGRAICSPTIDLADAATFARSARRPATLWDNYPVNDVAMTHELHIGPYRGRDPMLWRFATGVIANGMELFESSKIAIATIADYLAAPATYDPESSWRTAIRDVVGAADVDAFARFADNVRSSCLSEDDAPVVGHALEAFAFARHDGRGREAAGDLRGLAETLIAAADHLLRGPVGNAAIIAEARPWITAFETGAQALQRMADLEADDRLASDGPAELRPYLERLRLAPVRVFGDVMEMTLADLTGNHLIPGQSMSTL